jgi:hypothetical protein
MVTKSARGAIGRRGTLRPCRSGFESPRADHPSVAERWDHPGGDIVEGKDTALSARKYGLRSDSALRESLRFSSLMLGVRVPLSSPGWARRSTGGFLACTQAMRVRFPPSPPMFLLRREGTATFEVS